MKLFSGKPGVVQLQLMVWLFFLVALMLSLMQMDSFGQAITYAFLNTGFYAVIVYGNISWLYPKLYLKGRVVWYIIAVAAFLIAIGFLRAYITLSVYNAFFAKKPEVLGPKPIINIMINGLVIFLLSFVFRIAIAYFTLKRQSEEIIAQKTKAELDLLKSQVQPHFLFNTLNNIYYEAYIEAPRTAGLIEQLSNIMRYFVDESSRQWVCIGTEVQFIENYIALEKLRIRYDVDISFTKQYDAAASIPPMLLMTFVENIFKHGIDKSSTQNKVSLILDQENGRLTFTATNTLPTVAVHGASTGLGIANLQKRLTLLYGNDFELTSSADNNVYTAYLNIPLA